MAEASEATRSESGGLPADVKTFAKMIEDLEEQLDRVIATNEALAKDLADERNKRSELEGTVEELRDRLRRDERDEEARAALRAEINHLTAERSKLNASVRELKEQVADGEQESARQARVIERLRAARRDALEDVATVEAQFEHAMRLLGDSRAQLTVLKEERAALEGRTKILEDKLAQLQVERDALAGEVDQSREALNDVRRALADACATSNAVLEDQRAEGA